MHTHDGKTYSGVYKMASEGAQQRYSSMEFTNLKLQPEEYEKIMYILSSLREKLRASSVSLISRSGQEIAYQGDGNSLDRQALSSLAASNLAATFGLAKLLDEAEFERIFHKGQRASILIKPAGGLALLLFVLNNEEKAMIDLKNLNQATMILDDMLEKSNQR